MGDLAEEVKRLTHENEVLTKQLAELQAKEALTRAEADGAGILLLEVQQECIQWRLRTRTAEARVDEMTSELGKQRKYIRQILNDDLGEEEAALGDVIRASRTVQDFLWGRQNDVWDLEEWRRIFRKRVVKIDEIDPANPYALIELKKRLLQTAALAVAMITLIERKGMPPTDGCPIPSNLPKYGNKIEEK